MSREQINIVWFKRDLRILDHEPLSLAAKSELPFLCIYILEPIIINDAHYSERHIHFIKESLQELRTELESKGAPFLIIQESAPEVFELLDHQFEIKNVFSYQETGLWITFQRDLTLKKCFNEKNINWHESVANGVFRGLKNRKTWKDGWIDFMNKPLQNPDLDHAYFVSKDKIVSFQSKLNILNLNTPRSEMFQKGGTRTALKYLNSFFKNRILEYNSQYSKPLTSRKHSSRLSPYLAWGNLSVRMVIKMAGQQTISSGKKRLYDSFLSRMRWQAHFIQKFEMEPEMEFRSVHSAYRNLDKQSDSQLQKAWREGKTGYPLVDAAMRCLNATGFVNFRLRALLVSFFTHHLWQPWQDCSEHLAQQFLDFEPGIHYPQLQMQAGETGINIVRVYSPIKNSLEHDPDAQFLKKWVPELANLPLPYIHEPWKMPPMEQQFLNFDIKRDYYEKIVEVSLSRKRTQDTLYGIQKSIKAKAESQRIVEKHTNPKRKVWVGSEGLK
ncbi:MAG: deoxyribodipyrimidine photo-lyase [Nonlabens sp.]